MLLMNCMIHDTLVNDVWQLNVLFSFLSLPTCHTTFHLPVVGFVLY